ncbi:MAG: TolC family protein [Chitinophagaceae bacterium]|nr:MAG: TolC family protein [Chitinophagaceae bacterium]
MKLTAIFIFGFLCLCCSSQSQAQQLMTLDEAITIGLKNNYNILMAKNQEAAAAVDYQYAFGAFLPTINGSASKTWSTESVSQKYSNGNKVERNGAKSGQTALSANLNWTLFDGLKVFATKDKLKAIEEAGTLTVKNQVVNTIAQIIQSYYNIVQQKEQLASIAEQMSISEERVKIAKNEFTSGLGSKIDLLQAQVDLNSQKAAYLQQQTLIEESKASLNQLIAISVDNEYSVSDSIPVDTSLNYISIKQVALANNPGLLLAKKNIDISQLALKEVQRSRLPTISFNSSYAFSSNNSEAGFFLLNQTRGLNYGFSASVPIFQGFLHNQQAKNAQLNIAYSQLSLQNQQSLVSVELRNAYKSYEYYIKAIRLAEENLTVAEENVNVNLAAFQQGQVSSLEVKEAQQSLAEARFTLISARYNAKLAETNLLMLKGDIVKSAE